MFAKNERGYSMNTAKKFIMLIALCTLLFPSMSQSDSSSIDRERSLNYSVNSEHDGAASLPEIGAPVDCACDDQYATDDRVRTLVDNPGGSSGLLTGAIGTVICGATAGGPPNQILISWDNWQQGHDGNGYCQCPVDSLPDDSGWYLHCGQFALADICEGDFDDDKDVDGTDAAVFKSDFGRSLFNNPCP